MPFARKVILHSLRGYHPHVDEIVEQMISDGVIFVAVAGKDASKIEDIIDEICVGDGSRVTQDILTSSHEGQSLERVIQFSDSLTGEFAGAAQIVEI